MVLVAIVGYVFVTRPAPNSTPVSSTSLTIEGVKTFGALSRDHKAPPLTYNQDPPVGGLHATQWQSCGIYNQPIPLELAVHSLEHGAVWIAYESGIAASELELLVQHAKNKPFVLLAPYLTGRLSKPIVVVAWGYRLEPDNAADPRLGAFMLRYANSPDSPEPGAPCRGGLGKPLGG